MTRVELTRLRSLQQQLALMLIAGSLLASTAAASLHILALQDEFAYLFGARRFAETGSLHSVFYEAYQILEAGFPLQDVHTPGYVILLGSFMRIFPGGYWSAVAFNALCYALSSILLWDLARALGRDDRAAWAAAAIFLVLPTSLLYSFWVMAEVTLGFCFLATAWAAARFGARVAGATLAGVFFGATFLVRESALFGLPAIVGLVSRSRRALGAFLVTILLFLVLIYIPLSDERAPGGANMWSPGVGHAFGYQPIQVAMSGRWKDAFVLTLGRIQKNFRELAGAGWAESGVLLTYGLLPLWASLSWRTLPPLQKRFFGGLLLGTAALVGVLFAFYIVGGWSGYRYMMFLMPIYLVWLVPVAPVGSVWTRAAPPIGVGLLCLALDKGAHDIFTSSKSTALRGAGAVEYIERYVTDQPERIVWRRGSAWALKHYPTEVIYTLPRHKSEFKALELAVWFDYVVLPRDSDWLEGRLKYERANADDPLPRFKIYRRIR